VGYLISEFVFEGVLANYTYSDLIGGFNTPIASKINTGDPLKGNIYVDPSVTPLLNSMHGPFAKSTWNVTTGTYNYQGRVLEQNGLNYSIYWYSLYTGEKFITVPYGKSMADYYNPFDPVYNSQNSYKTGSSRNYDYSVDPNTFNSMLGLFYPSPVETWVCISSYVNGTCY